MAETGFTIGRLAAAAGVNVETVRYYHRRGLLPLPARPLGQIRRYGADSLARIGFIRRAQRLGFTLDEIEALLELNDGKSCRAAQGLARHKLDEIRDRVRDLRSLEATLVELIGRCERSGGRVCCPLIDNLAKPANTLISPARARRTAG